MNWDQIEEAFSRSWGAVISLKYFLFVFPCVFACGALTILCWGLSYHTTPWISVTLQFVPLFVASAVLMTVGIVVSRLYIDKIQRQSTDISSLLLRAVHILRSIAIFAFPLLCLYLICWVGMGALFLLKLLPWVGEFLSIFLSIGPFVFILCSLLVAVMSLALSFFLSPILAVQQTSVQQILAQIWQGRILTGVVFFLIAAFPLAVSTLLLVSSAMLTDTAFFLTDSSLFIVMQRILLLLPCSFLVSPAIVFFFHFATESFLLCKRYLCDLQ